MKIGDLIDALQEFDESTEVRIAHQPTYPLEYSIGEVAEDIGHRHSPVCIPGDDDKGESAVWYCADPDCGKEFDREPRDYDLAEDPDASSVVYIGEGAQLGYLPGSAADTLGWVR
jgi:hypothetical protein